MSDTEQFLRIEIDENLWQPAIDGIHLWAALREDVKWSLNRRAGNFEQRQTAAAWRVLHPKLWSKHARTLSFLATPNKPPAFDTFVMIWNNDHIYRYIYQHLANPLILESTWFGQVTSDNWGHYPTLLDDTLKVWGAVLSKLRRLPAKQMRQIEEFVAHVTQVYDIPENHGRYIRLVADHINRYHILKPIVQGKLVPQMKSRTAFVSIAAYMARKAAWVQLLHEADCTVIEAQHGFIGKDNISYQHSQSVLDDPHHPSRLYMPNELWMFGQYWAEQAHVPSKKPIIGFPRLQQHLTALHDKFVSNDKQILIISQWTITKQLVDLACELADALPEYQLVYKLHPVETKFPDQYEPLRQRPTVEIASGGDIYQWVAESGIVVGSYSTVLVEALAFPQKRIFNLRNALLEDNIVTTFDTVDELIACITDGQSGYSAHDPTYYWQDEPEKRIKQLLMYYHLL